MKKKVSIIIPLYQNENNISLTYTKLSQDVFVHLPEYELILIDDGSKDNSYQEALKLQAQNDKVRVIKLSRNFGQHQAIMAGYANSTGDCIVTIAADMQDPPELIIQMYLKWKEGSKVVFAARKSRKDGIISELFSKITYKLVKPIFANFPQGGIGFSLIDKSIKDLLIKMNEKNSTVFYQVLWMGFNPFIIYYERPIRDIGKSTYTVSKKIKNLVDLILQFSYYPIRLISIFGIIDCFFSFIYMMYLMFHKIFGGVSLSGWPSLMTAIMFTSGVQMLTLGIIGEYLWRNFDATRTRPLYIIDEKSGFNDNI